LTSINYFLQDIEHRKKRIHILIGSFVFCSFSDVLKCNSLLIKIHALTLLSQISYFNDDVIIENFNNPTIREAILQGLSCNSDDVRL